MFALPPPSACEIQPGFIECVLPAAQLQFMDPLPLDCQISEQGEYSFKLRCRTDIGTTDTRWIKGPTPVVHLPPLPQPKKKVKKKKIRKRP